MTENRGNPSKYNLRILSPGEVDESHVAAWSALEARAIEGNAFLSPYFVLPAIRYLEEDKNPLILFVEKMAAGIPNLVGVAVFNAHKPSRKFPLPYLSLFSSIHSYLSGFLVDREYAPEVTEQIYRFIMDPKRGWHGLRVKNLAADGDFASVRQTVESTLGIKWQPSRSWQRPIFIRIDVDDASAPPKKTLKDYHRYLRGLGAMGSFEWRVVHASPVLDQAVDELMRLENLGWKGDGGTSLLSDARQTAFFGEMAAGFNAAGRFFITEVRLDDKVISSASNLISGNYGFGFKLGWDRTYAKYAPSIVNLLQLWEHKNELPFQIDTMDSSAAPGSYMDHVWQGRRSLADGVYALSSLGKLVLSTAQIFRKTKELFKKESGG